MIVNRSFLISSLTFIFVFFPYIGPKIFPSDNQPYALLFSSVWLLLINKNKIKLLKGHYLLISATFVALLIAITELEFFMISFRSLIGYLSFLILNIFFYNHSRYYSFPIKTFRLIIYIWFFVALVQTFIYRDFLSFLISNFRSHELRGALSLAPEPSYLGVIGCFFLIISHTYLRDKSLSVISFFLVLLSQSGFAIILMLFFLTLVSFKFLIKIKLRNLIFYFTLLLLFSFALFNIFDISFISQRLYFVITSLFTNPIDFIYLDGSSSDRFFHVVYSFLGAFESFFIPNGYLYWDQYAWQKFNETKFVWITTGRIMSTYGAMLFELGFFGFLIIFYINKQLFNSNFSKFTLLITINFYLLFAIPLAFPLLPLLLNLKNYKYDRYKQESFTNENFSKN